MHANLICFSRNVTNTMYLNTQLQQNYWYFVNIRDIVKNEF
jgi:hypothetical protein